MRITANIAAVSLLGTSLLITGCATKKYVAQTVAPIDARVTSDEAKNDAKNGEQDKLIADHGKSIEELDRSVSRTREQLRDTDAKAIAANEAAAKADQKADGAWKAADGAKNWPNRPAASTAS
jgi:hypothetical protein